MTLSADPASVFFRRVFYQAFMGLVLVGDIFAFVTIDAPDFPMHRVNVVFIDAVSIPAPHLRGGNASTGYGCGPSCRSRAVAVHLLEISMTLDTLTA